MIGKLKVLSDRWLVYVSRSQFLMVAYLFVKETEIHWGWIVLGLVVSLMWMVVDVKYILPQEMEYQTRKNPEWKRVFGG